MLPYLVSSKSSERAGDDPHGRRHDGALITERSELFISFAMSHEIPVTLRLQKNSCMLKPLVPYYTVIHNSLLDESDDAAEGDKGGVGEGDQVVGHLESSEVVEI